MKKRIFSLTFTALLICFFLCGCNGCKKGWFAGEHEFLYQKMSEISVENNTYYLGDEWSEQGVINVSHVEKEHILQGEAITIAYVETEQRVYSVFNVQYKEYNFNINIKFMEDRSDAYVKIHNIWKEKIDNYNSKSEIVQFKVFDNKLFIVTCGMSTHLSGSVRGEVPYCLYYYDFETDNLTYCGFYAGNYDEEFGSYSGFREGQYIVICKK